MEIQSKNFLSLISSYINDSEAELSSPDWVKIFELSEIHSLAGILYAAVKKTNLCGDKKILEKLNGSFAATVKYSVVQEIAAHNLTALLIKNHQRLMLIKGIVLRNFYTDKELRTMGDIDIVIEPGKKKQVHEILMNEGYVYDEFNSHSDVLNYSKNGVNFEIHTKVMSKNLFCDVDCISYFDGLFKYAEKKSEFIYEMKPEYHFVYLITHMARHFKHGGCGLRMFMDIVFFIKHYENLDRIWIGEQLKYLKLASFADSVLGFCNEYLGTNFSFLIDKPDSSGMEALADYIVAGGTFGHNGKNLDAIKVGNTNGSFTARLIGMKKFVFPSYEHLKARYVWFGDMPKWLLPIGWVRAWWFRIVKNKENSVKHLMNVIDDKDAGKHMEMMNIAGLSEVSYKE